MTVDNAGSVASGGEGINPELVLTAEFVVDEKRIVVTREMLKRLLRSSEGSVSSGVGDVIVEFSERVGEDVLEDFVKERR